MSGRGVFVTFEGGEGCGKSTQLKLLARRLEAAGVPVRTLREPGGTAVGEAVRAILLDPEHAGLDDTAEILLYEAARAQLVAEVIEPALEAGEVVLCDRFYDSTTAYQGHARGIPLGHVDALNLAATGGLAPDRTIVLGRRARTRPHAGHEPGRRPPRVRGPRIPPAGALRLPRYRGRRAGPRPRRGRLRRRRHGRREGRGVPRRPAAVRRCARWRSMTRCVFDDLVGQERVASFMRAAVESGRVSHAYLFVGPPGSGKATAAKSLACAVLCDDNGCGTCGDCYRIRRGAHPDVHLIEPEGAAGFLKEQIEDIIHDVNLSPIDGHHKLYIVKSADLFNDASANAFLKTLEEPPDDVIIVLMAHSFDAVLPTIASRCQVVRFRRIPPSESTAILVAQTGVDTRGSGRRARGRRWRRSPRPRLPRQPGPPRGPRPRSCASSRTCSTPTTSTCSVAAKELLAAVKAPLEDVKAAQGDRDHRALRLPGPGRQQDARRAAQARADRS